MRQSIPWFHHLATQTLVTLSVLLSSTAFAELDLGNAAVEQLDNGLTVILLEDRNFQVASVQMLYRIGARDEVSGKTGLAHFLEHMAFRDTENFPNTDVVSSIYARGGEWHGYTWTDQTTYFATVPSEHLDLLLQIEADRMSRLIIAEGSMEPERGAVLAEMHMYENDPTSMLIDAVMFTSFLGHPYRNNTIGWQSDIENLKHEDVVRFYKEHYHPSNGVLVVVGDINSERTLARISELFGGFERKAPTPLPVTIEPLQVGERRIQLHGNSDNRQFMIGYRAPSGNSPDFAAFLVLQELLGGGSGVSFLQNDWGTLVKRDSLLAGAADDLTTWFPPSAQDYIFIIAGAARSGVSQSDTEQEIENRVTMIREHSVHSTTLSAAIASTQEQLVFDVETTEDAAHQLAFFEGLHALDKLLTLSDRVTAVTAADVQRVAQRWLLPRRRTIAWHLPREADSDHGSATPPMNDPEFENLGPVRAIDNDPLPPPILRNLRSGLPVIVQHSDLSKSVHVQIVVTGSNIVVDNAPMGSPSKGYTSLTVRRPSSDLEAAIAESLLSLSTAAIVHSPSVAISMDPATRLEQTFEQYMGTVKATEVVPALIVVSGTVNEDDVIALLEQHFGDLEFSSAGATTAPAFSGEKLTVELGQSIAQAQLGYIVSAPGPDEPDYDAVRLLQYIFSHGYEGRLGKEAISNQGLAYYIDTRYQSDGTNGWVTLAIGVDPQKIARLKTLLLVELQRLNHEPPTVVEFEEAKAHLIGRAKSAAQSNEELATALAQQWLWHGNTRISETLERRLETVSYRDILAIVPDFIDGLTIVVAQ